MITRNKISAFAGMTFLEVTFSYRWLQKFLIKIFITPDRRDILVPPMLEAELDLQQAPPIDSTY
jgi:hypothetical protein